MMRHLLATTMILSGIGCSSDETEVSNPWPTERVTHDDGLTLSEGIACRPDAPPPGQFTEMAETIGIDLVHAETAADGKASFNAGGLSLGDFDEDGIMDIYATSGVGPDRFYLSGGRVLNYTAMTSPATVPRAQSATVGDLNRDGHLDILVSGEAYQILLGDGRGGLTIAESNLAEVFTPLGPFAAFSFADFDGDGWLDVAGVNGDELTETNNITMGALDMLAAGGPGLQFTDVPLPQSAPNGVGCLPGWFDFDNDGDQDLFIINDFGYTIHGNRLLRNDGNHTFVDVSTAANAGQRVAGMGGAFGDFDNDGFEDVYVTSMLDSTTVAFDDREGTNLLLRNQGDATFKDDVDARKAWGLTLDHAVAWGAIFFDADADADLDLFVVRAFEPTVLDPYSAPGVLYDHPDAFLRNDGATFSEVAADSGLGQSAVTQAPYIGDLNRDGFDDLIVSVIWGRPLVYLNGCDDRHWLTVGFEGADSPIGAVVTVTAGALTQRREIRSGGVGAGGSSAPEATFGLGDAAMVDSLKIQWPDGVVRTYDDVPSRRIAWVTRP